MGIHLLKDCEKLTLNEKVISAFYLPWSSSTVTGTDTHFFPEMQVILPDPGV